MLTRILCAAAVLALLASPLQAGQCPLDIEKIDAALAANPDMDGELKAQVVQLRDEGEALHNQGNHAESVETLAIAKELLAIPD